MGNPIQSTPSRVSLFLMLCLGWAGWAIFIAGFVRFSHHDHDLYSRREYGSHILFLIIAGGQLVLLFLLLIRPSHTLSIVVIVACVFGVFCAGLTLDKDCHSKSIGYREPKHPEVVKCIDAGEHSCTNLKLDIVGAVLYSTAALVTVLLISAYSDSPAPIVRNKLMILGFLFAFIGLIIFYAGWLDFIHKNRTGHSHPGHGIYRGRTEPHQYGIAEWTSVVIFAIGMGVAFLAMIAALAVTSHPLYVLVIFILAIVATFNGAAFDYVIRILDTGFRTHVWPPIECGAFHSACQMMDATLAGIISFFVGLVLFIIALYGAITGDMSIGQLDTVAIWNGADWVALYPRKEPLHGTPA
jgi:hypothetical protein